MTQTTPLQTGYGRVYQRWHSYTPDHIAQQQAYFTRLLQELLPVDRQARILDLGCGMGFTLITLAQLGYTNGIGVDRDRDLVRGCQQQGLPVFHSPDGVAFLRDQVEPFDAILLLDLLEHIPVQTCAAFLNAVYRSLRPGGRVILTTPNANASIAMRWRYICWTHETSFTETSLELRLLHAGFQDIDIRGYELMQKPHHPLLPSRASLRWALLRSFRLRRKLELIAELGWSARELPITPNLLATGYRR